MRFRSAPSPLPLRILSAQRNFAMFVAVKHTAVGARFVPGSIFVFLNSNYVMSKGSLFWANASGKLGESVFYRSGGEQRNRTYVKHIKNPKTESQMRNRIQMSNWAAMYRRLKPILSKTFTARSSAESGFNALVKANKSRLRYAISKEMLESCNYVPVGARVSSGSIVCNIKPITEALNDPWEKGTPPKFYINMTTFSEVTMTFPANDYPTDPMTGAQLYELLTANGNPMQLPSDFKIIVFVGAVDVDDAGEKYADGGMPLSYRVYDCNQKNDSLGSFVGADELQYISKLKPRVSKAGQMQTDTPTTVGIDGLLLGGAVTEDDLQDYCVGIVIYYENASGVNANNAFIYGCGNAVQAAVDFAEGGDIFNDILSETGFSASGSLSGSVSAVAPDIQKYQVVPLPVEEEEEEED